MRQGYFAELLEREELKAQILRLAKGGTSRALLFIGAAGSGKHFASMAAAEAMLCQNLDEQGPCGTCDSCRYLRAGTHPDFASLELEDDEKIIPVKRVRAFASGETQLLPQVSKQRVFLIDASYLNEQGQNALLKTLEEPPLRAVFLLRVEQADQLLPTVRSRVLEIAMPSLSDQALQIIARQQEGVAEDDFLTPEQEQLRLKLARGNPGRYLTLLDSEAWLEAEPMVRKYLLALARGNLGQALGIRLQTIKDIVRDDPGPCFYFLKAYGHDLLRIRLGLEPVTLLHPEAKAALEVLDQKTRPGTTWLQDYHTICEDYERALERKLNAELQLAAMTIKLDEVMHEERSRRNP